MSRTERMPRSPAILTISSTFELMIRCKKSITNRCSYKNIYIDKNIDADKDGYGIKLRPHSVTIFSTKAWKENCAEKKTDAIQTCQLNVYLIIMLCIIIVYWLINYLGHVGHIVLPSGRFKTSPKDSTSVLSSYINT